MPQPVRSAVEAYAYQAPDVMTASGAASYRGEAATMDRDHRAWRALRQRVLAEAAALNRPCALCGLRINYRARRNAPGGPTVDHVESWRDRPDLRLDPANLQVAHRGCNASKGADRVALSAGNASRRWLPG